VSTDEGLTGYGEVCPLGPAYLAAYAAGAQTGIAEIALHLMGLDPTQLQAMNRRMDQALRGHPYVLIADANTGWTQHQALWVADAVRHTEVYLEQPCLHYEECLAVRHHTNRPFVLDEVIDDVHMVLRGHADKAMDVINLKISKVGGPTKARQIASGAPQRNNGRLAAATAPGLGIQRAWRFSAHPCSASAGLMHD
jgi:L-alanine-DL-glutamate epimerase-like enolase superfamily enzyme